MLFLVTRHKKKSTGAKAISHACRNNGSCDYCKDNRTFFDRRHRVAAENDIKLEVDALSNKEEIAIDSTTYDGEL